eukprot:GEMP01048821.1.p1 GENE.GEMP01048821.1~~GEMP01048821.1.p1  ORF type:complete len:221 (+),score=41.13 GEMP01048821.1:26-664(+)
MSHQERLTYLVYRGSSGTAVVRYMSKADGAVVKAKLGELKTPLLVELLEIEDEEKRREAFATMLSEISKIVELDSARMFVHHYVLSVICTNAVREFFVRNQVSLEDAPAALTLEFGGARHCANKLIVDEFNVHILSFEEEAFLEAQSVRFALEKAGKKLSDFRGVMSTSSWTSQLVFFNGPGGDVLAPLIVPWYGKTYWDASPIRPSFLAPT